MSENNWNEQNQQESFDENLYQQNPYNGNSYNGNPYQQPNGGQQTPPPYPYGYKPPERKGFAIASLVLGILSLLLCCVYGGFLGILGLVFGILSLVKKESKMGMAIAGIITSAFGIVYGICWIIASVMTVQYGTENFDKAYYEEFYSQLEDDLYGTGNSAGADEKDIDTEVAEDASEDEPFAGKSFELGDESVIYFAKDGTFLWYQDDGNHEDNYYVGTYDFYQAELAEAYIVTYLGEYGVTEDELEEFYQHNEENELYSEENFTCLVLHNESLISGGEEQITVPYDTNYMGFYMDGNYDAANMASGEYVLFTEQ